MLPKVLQYYVERQSDMRQILGIMPLGTSLDYESERSRKLGCWTSLEPLGATILGFSSNTATPDFVPGDDFSGFLVDSGLGLDCPSKTREYWKNSIAENYHGNEGRRRIRMAAINLRDRDGLHSRLTDVKCPVLWLHVSS